MFRPSGVFNRAAILEKLDFLTINPGEATGEKTATQPMYVKDIFGNFIPFNNLQDFKEETEAQLHIAEKLESAVIHEFTVRTFIDDHGEQSYETEQTGSGKSVPAVQYFTDRMQKVEKLFSNSLKQKA